MSAETATAEQVEQVEQPETGAYEPPEHTGEPQHSQQAEDAAEVPAATEAPETIGENETPAAPDESGAEATTEYRRPIDITVPARAAALAWINAFLATGDDDAKPELYKTLSLEWFEGRAPDGEGAGLQLVGCDGHALFRSWVPREAGDRWPETDEKPTRSVVVMDAEGFGLSFLRSLLKVTADEAHALDELTVTTAAVDEDATLALGADFMRERLELRACGQRIDLKLHDRPFPNWRRLAPLTLGLDAAERVDGMKIATWMFATVSRIKGAQSVELEFHGAERAVAFVSRGTTEVRGLLMPMKRPDRSKSDEEAHRQQEAREKAAQTDAFATGASGETGGGHPAGEVVEGAWHPPVEPTEPADEEGGDGEEQLGAGDTAEHEVPATSSVASNILGILADQDEDRRAATDRQPDESAADGTWGVEPPPRVDSDAVQEIRAAVEAGEGSEASGAHAEAPKRKRRPRAEGA